MGGKGYRRIAVGKPGAACALVLIGFAAMGGCQRTLFAQEPFRSPYDRHDRLLNQHAEPYVYDAFGKRRPNLRGRLAPQD